MAHRAVSLRYLAAKLAHAVDVAAAQLGAAQSLPEAVARGAAAYRQQLTSVMLLAGAAMAPTFNPKAPKDLSSDQVGGRASPRGRRPSAWPARRSSGAARAGLWSLSLQLRHRSWHPALAVKAANQRCSTPGRPQVESLLLRLIPRPSARTVFSGDVVAFNRCAGGGEGAGLGR